MRYDRPVRELLAECCRELTEPFSITDVVGWFAEHHPEFAVNTVRTQFHVRLGRGELAVVRVAHGSYRRAEPGQAEPVIVESTERRAVAGTSARVLLLGCVKTKASVPLAARALYTSPLWQRRVAYAENADVPWWVLSAKHGIVDPDDVIAPYDLSLRQTSSAYRAAWGEFVAQQLATRFPLHGRVVEVHAGDPYVDAVRGPLSRLGAVVDDPVDADSMGAMLAWYADRTARPDAARAVPSDVAAQTAAAMTALSSPSDAVALDAVGTGPTEVIDRPGLYGWWVDTAGASDLSRGLGVAVAAGLIYAGQAGASRSGGSTSANTLRGRILGMHLGGSRGMSTLRRSLSAVLDHAYGVDGGEDELTAWMHEHLTVALWPTDDRDALRFVETEVLRRLDPPLNLRQMEPSPLRQRLSQLRSPRP